MTEKKKDGKLVFHERTEMIFKIIVVGDPAVGKTSLLTNFCGDKFNYEYIPTVGVNITKEPVTIKDDMGKDIIVNLMVWDIAGQPQFYMLHRPYFNGADGMMLIYDITRSSSFSNINNWYSTAVKYGLSGIPRILIGNKIDLKEERKIILPMAEHLSEKIGAQFFETSALTGENVQLIFQKIAELTLRSKLEE
ncbi:MAG: Rab family GTPase [Promethearchaeota archaeon]